MCLQTVLRVERNVIAWFEVQDPAKCRKERFPVCVVRGEVAGREDGDFYLFPVFEEPGMKIGRFDHLRERVDKPEKLKRSVSKLDEQVRPLHKLDC